MCPSPMLSRVYRRPFSNKLPRMPCQFLQLYSFMVRIRTLPSSKHWSDQMERACSIFCVLYQLVQVWLRCHAGRTLCSMDIYGAHCISHYVGVNT